jgi:trigger factor
MAFRRRVRGVPEVKIGDLATAEVEKLSAEVTDAPSTRRSTSCASSAAPSPSAPMDAAAQDGDRVTVDFEGKIDGEPFPAARPRTSSSWSAKARCSRSSKTPCAA